ncbi:hypothetical protein [Enterobacter asburiae]|uniref:hypothetical protein n=1 Tax=Enterobacter asburiae TaxID=61645 RepID=UPI003906C841
MSTITKEWLQQKIAGMEATRDEIPFGLDEDDSNTLAALRIALASLEAEIKLSSFIATQESLGVDFEKVLSEDIEELYVPGSSAPPAPVSVPDFSALDRLAGEMLTHAMNCERRVAVAYTHCAHRLAEEVRDLRAAMLQGAEPVKTAYKLPVNTPCKEAPEQIWLQTAGVWPENGEFSELTWCSDNQHPDDTLYVRADVVGGNSPVIPDGWVMVPVEPTEDMIVHGFESEPDESFSDEKEWEAYVTMSGCQQAAHRAKLCWAAMITAAPKPDVR